MRSLALIALLSCTLNGLASLAQLAPNQIVFQSGPQVNYSEPLGNAKAAYTRAQKVAIIGAGAGGSSAAYFLSKAQTKLENLGFGAQGIDITLFERDERIGGRTTVVHAYDDENLPAIELGASIFADVNKNLQRASKQFNLETGAKLGEDGVTGVWDGQQFLIEGLDDGWWNSAKMFWRYGYSPLTTQKLVGKTVDAFLRLYDPAYMHKSKDEKKATDTNNSSSNTESGYPWRTIEDLAKAMSFDQMVARSAGDYFYLQSVSKLFIEEIIEAATLVNYGQEVYSIHGLGGSVSLAASGATGVVGGNYKIFESMLGHCEALHLRLGIHGEVTGLAKFKTLTEAGSTTKWWLGTKSGYGGLFDAVFIAAPWHSADITLLNTNAVIPTPRYVHLHVTLVITKADQPNPAYFGRGEKDVIPNSILTSHASVRKAEEEEEKKKKRKEDGDDKNRGPKLDFNSLTYLEKIPSRTEEGKEDHIVKLFSQERLSDDKLNEIFGQDSILWTYRKEWDAYPYLTPTTTFPKIKADDNLYFLNAMETFISTMETATLSARNAVALYLEQLYGSDFVHGGKNCPWQKENATKDDKEPQEGESDWAAWGCQSA
ncbi:uncharacterized protein FA14DRAFT_140693 [Meira miltonrushii]|uniref:Prenylcysteine lyase domain-containing protein n=1 Tax=Meira miltonrushii TaxID=1280837 RepID=A0A316VGP1_9BASI|nr:uncharacterized protein FA14DRAFT_140693 [Meira miltonrushii]PWN36762.1 hypothetical protein FA14DRAFT_140693 [Meira miltonrushii]